MKYMSGPTRCRSSPARVLLSRDTPQTPAMTYVIGGMQRVELSLPQCPTPLNLSPPPVILSSSRSSRRPCPSLRRRPGSSPTVSPTPLSRSPSCGSTPGRPRSPPQPPSWTLSLQPSTQTRSGRSECRPARTLQGRREFEALRSPGCKKLSSSVRCVMVYYCSIGNGVLRLRKDGRVRGYYAHGHTRTNARDSSRARTHMNHGICSPLQRINEAYHKQ